MVKHGVAPYAGAWVEIMIALFLLAPIIVAPYAGAWVEIFMNTSKFDWVDRRSLRGSVG